VHGRVYGRLFVFQNEYIIGHRGVEYVIETDAGPEVFCRQEKQFRCGKSERKNRKEREAGREYGADRKRYYRTAFIVYRLMIKW